MKATGIVRRIDDLGRVVVPKEIRRTLRIREGDPLEIYTDREGEIILKKYSPIGEFVSICISVRKGVVRDYGIFGVHQRSGSHHCCLRFGKKKIRKAAVSKELEEILERRKTFLAHKGEKDFFPVTESDPQEYESLAVATIIAHGDAIGSVVMFSRDHKLQEPEKQMVVTAAGFLGSQMEQ